MAAIHSRLVAVGLSPRRIARAFWDEGQGIVVDITGRNPVAHITATAQKSNRTESITLAPEFGDLLAAAPVEARTGFVCNPLYKWGKRATRDVVGRTISAIGKKGKVKTWINPKTGKHRVAAGWRNWQTHRT